MIRVNMEQGSDKWLEHRYQKIGGTSSKGLFTDSNTLLIDILSRFLEPYEPEESFPNSAMERGNELEPYAVAELNKYTGLEFNEVGWLQSDEIPLIGISPDGITDDDRFSCEIKCVSRKKHTEIMVNNIVPMDYIHQCVHYFTINPNLEKHYFAAFRPENILVPLFVKELTRESVVDLGLKKKIEIEQVGKKGTPIKSKIKTVPDLRTINEWVKLSRLLAKEMQLEINKKIKELKF